MPENVSHADNGHSDRVALTTLLPGDLPADF